MESYILCENCNNKVSKFAYTRHHRACVAGRIKAKTLNLQSEKLPNGKSKKWLDAMNARRGRGTNQYTKAKELSIDPPVISDETRDKLSKCASLSHVNRWTLEARENMSRHAKRRGLGGKFINSRYDYNGISLASSYEVNVAKSLDENSIKWVKCVQKFEYTDHTGKIRNYIPDFYLPDYNVFLDPKNDFLIKEINPGTGLNDLEKISIVMKTHNIKVIVLDKDHLVWEKIKLLMLE